MCAKSKVDITYASQRDKQNIILLRETISHLPEFSVQFFRAIETQTTVLTRLEYARDLNLFFQYLFSEIALFTNTNIKSFSISNLGQITRDHIERYAEYLMLYLKDDREYINKEASIMRKLSSLRSYFKYYYKTEAITNDVASLVDLPKLHSKPIIKLEVDEIAKMLDAVDNGDAFTDVQKKYHKYTRLRDLAIMTLFLGTGIRVSECVGINIDDIDFNINGFNVTRKGGNQTTLYFSDEVAVALKDYLTERLRIDSLSGHESALFLSLQKRRITVRSVELMVKKYASIVVPLKKKFSPHKLRSTYATSLYESTNDIYLVADVLGHSDVNTTRKHYAALSDSKRRLAATKVKLRDD